MERWVLHHPEKGVYEVLCGYDKEFLEEFPDWPISPDKAEDFSPGAADDFLVARGKARILNPSLRVQIMHEGEVVQRLNRVPSGRQALRPLTKFQTTQALNEPVGIVGQGECLIFTRGLDGHIQALLYKHGKERIEWEPPAGSRGEHYLQRMNASRFNRFLFPLIGGLGKSGWVAMMLLLSPIIGSLIAKILDWILGFIPDFEFPSWPSIWLPTIELPHIWLPTLSFSLPHIHVPEWIQLIMEYQRVWMPILIALAAGIIAMRNHKKSEEFKAQKAQEPEGEDISEERS